MVDSKDHEGNTPHMLTYRFDAGVPCQTLLGTIIKYGLVQFIFLTLFLPLLQIKSVTKPCRTTKEKLGVI